MGAREIADFLQAVLNVVEFEHWYGTSTSAYFKYKPLTLE